MTTQTLPISTRRDPSIVVPLVLIALGVAILLVNAGYLSGIRWSDVLQLWPLLLVLAGVDILVRPRSFALAAVTEIAIIVVAAAYLTSSVTALPANTSFDVTVPRAGVSDLNVTVNYGAGMLTLAGGASDLLSVRSSHQDVTRTVDQSGPSAAIVLDANPGNAFTFGRDRRWDITLPSDVRAELTLNLGAGDFDIDLSAVRVVRAAINSGASDLVIRLPRARGDVPMTISSGASSVQIIVPSGVEYSIESTGVMHSINGATRSPGYSAAADRLTIHLSAAMSSVTVK